MNKLNVSTLGSLAAILFTSAAFAATGAPLADRDADYMHWMDSARSAQTKQAGLVVQDGNYVFVLDAQWGTPISAVAVWDGCATGIDRTAATKQAGLVVQDGNYAFVLDAQWGTPISAVAVWDGYATGFDRAESAQASTVIQDGNYAFVVNGKSGAIIRAGAVWDGHVAQVESAPSSLTLVRLGSIAH